MFQLQYFDKIIFLALECSMFKKLNKNGNIPRGEKCPFGDQCPVRTNEDNFDGCRQTPEVEFSCAIARGFDMFGEEIPL